MKGRMIIALIVAAISFMAYFGSTQFNPVTGEKQRVGGISPRQEIALGLQAAPEMVRMHGGLSNDREAAAVVHQVGRRLVERTSAKDAPYKFEFHLLADRETVNAFALPGGQTFITEALMRRLKTEGQLAGVMAHEIGHVVARHGAQRLAKAQLTQGLTGAAVLATYDPERPGSASSGQVAMLIGHLVNLRYGREDELESDRLGVRFMSEAGYDPRALIQVMKVLQEAGGGGGQVEFFATHPNPENRIQRIEEAIKAQFPQGVPKSLTP
jgi:beta-barrel assembly-enhancing protease